MIIIFNTSYCNVLRVLKPKTKFGCSCFVMVRSIIYVHRLFILKKLNNVILVLNHLHSIPNHLQNILMYLPQNKLRNYFLCGCFTSHWLQRQNQFKKPGLLLFHHTSFLPPQQYPQSSLWGSVRRWAAERLWVMSDPGEADILWCRGRNERRAGEEAHGRREDSFNKHYLCNTD